MYWAKWGNDLNNNLKKKIAQIYVVIKFIIEWNCVYSNCNQLSNAGEFVH